MSDQNENCSNFFFFLSFFLSFSFQQQVLCCGVLCSSYSYIKQQDKNYGNVIHLSKLIYISMNTFSITFFLFMFRVYIVVHMFWHLSFFCFSAVYFGVPSIWKDIGYTVGLHFELTIAN